MSVLAILAVAIVRTGFTLVHVNAIEQHTRVGQLAVLFQLVDKFELALGGVAGTADVYAQISHTGDKLGVGHHTNRGSI